MCPSPGAAALPAGLCAGTAQRILRRPALGTSSAGHAPATPTGPAGFCPQRAPDCTLPARPGCCGAGCSGRPPGIPGKSGDRPHRGWTSQTAQPAVASGGHPRSGPGRCPHLLVSSGSRPLSPPCVVQAAGPRAPGSPRRGLVTTSPGNPRRRA
uniref:Putative nematode cuticle collagen domain protein n=1 Tax=Ixodes ricinus TaxID=34613 RepID=A0A147BAG5_IXORI